MTRPDRLYVDANIFIRLFEGKDELSAALTQLFLLEPRTTKSFLATSELSLAELLVVPCREGDEELISRYDNWTMSNPYLEVGPVDRAILWSAAAIRARYTNLKLPDAIHLATALQMGCSHFLSADSRVNGTYELSFRHWGMVLGPATIEVVRPDLELVQAMVASAQT